MDFLQQIKQWIISIELVLYLNLVFSSPCYIFPKFILNSQSTSGDKAFVTKLGVPENEYHSHLDRERYPFHSKILLGPH